MPAFEWRFLIGAFLPGVPLTYALLAGKIFPFMEPTAIYWWILLPLGLGLFVDAIRHGIELCFRKKGWLDSYVWHEVDNKDIQARGTLPDSYVQWVIARSTTIFHQYEFFANTALSVLISVLPGVFGSLDCYHLWFLIIIPVFGFCAYIRRREQEKLINDTFGSRQTLSTKADVKGRGDG